MAGYVGYQCGVVKQVMTYPIGHEPRSLQTMCCVTVQLSIYEELLYINVQVRFRGGLVFKAHILLSLSTLGSRVIKKKRRTANPRVCCVVSVKM